METGWILLGLAALWTASAMAAARTAALRGYPVIWASLLMGPLGLLAILRLTRTPRPPLETRHAMLQWAALAEEGLPAGPLPPPVEPRLLRLAELASARGREGAFASGLRDLVRFERLWDRMLPWLVLDLSLSVLGVVLLVGTAALAFRSPGTALRGALLLVLLAVGWLLRRLVRDHDLLSVETLLARGQALHIARCAALAGEPLPSNEDPTPLAVEAREAVAERLVQARRAGRLLGALFLLAGLLTALLPGLLAR